MSSEQDGQHGSSVLDNRSILLISLPLLSLFSEGDTCSLLNSMNVSDKVSEPYIKVSIQNLGVGAWSLWVHSLLWYMSERGLTYYLQSKVFQNQKHIFSEELITENLFLYSLNRTCQHIQLALSKGDQRWLQQLKLQSPLLVRFLYSSNHDLRKLCQHQYLNSMFQTPLCHD